MILFESVTKRFGSGDTALSDVSFSVEKGEFVFVVGPTGSGKTTLFRLIIRETLPSSGKIKVDDIEVSSLPKQKVSDLRKRIGVVFQDLKLLTDRTIFENVYLPLSVAGVKEEAAKAKVEEILKQVGMLEHKEKFPVQLSGGELQRIAIARALVLDPQLLLADEPTGNLDVATSWEIMKLLTDINKKGTTIIMATHNPDVIKSLGKRVIELDNGNLVKDANKEVKARDKNKEDDQEKKEKEPKEAKDEDKKIEASEEKESKEGKEE